MGYHAGEEVTRQVEQLCEALGAVEVGIEKLADELTIRLGDISEEQREELARQLHQIAEAAEHCHAHVCKVEHSLSTSKEK
ncbi:MAG: hypothetical protein M3Q29_14030 [Chloroflexota bacterium]|nr:hypothetical protein [Chloroflexota bacterium]